MHLMLYNVSTNKNGGGGRIRDNDAIGVFSGCELSGNGPLRCVVVRGSLVAN